VAKHTVGCVPYLNARPLARLFADTGEVEVIYDVPSKLPKLLDSGVAEAVLASAFDALKTPGRTYAEGVSIGSNGAVESVKLFSKVPFGQIDSLALDASSLTSNALARALLAESYAISPRCEPALPDLNEMLKAHDAAILIGDKGMAASGEGLQVMDLGEAWTQLTGLPFVWAVWIGDENLSPELVTLLNQAARWGEGQTEMLASEAHAETGLPYEACVHYLRNVMDYRLTEAHLHGLRTYRDLLLKHALLSEEIFPTPIAMSKDAAFVP
jgi:chorismate dehydratase